MRTVVASFIAQQSMAMGLSGSEQSAGAEGLHVVADIHDEGDVALAVKMPPGPPYRRRPGRCRTFSGCGCRTRWPPCHPRERWRRRSPRRRGRGADRWWPQPGWAGPPAGHAAGIGRDEVQGVLFDIHVRDGARGELRARRMSVVSRLENTMLPAPMMTTFMPCSSRCTDGGRCAPRRTPAGTGGVHGPDESSSPRGRAVQQTRCATICRALAPLLGPVPAARRARPERMGRCGVLE